MSRVYFHSPSGDAELRGSERGRLRHLATGPAAAAWDLDGASSFERAIEIVSMVPEVDDGVHGANYLHTYMREAVLQDRANHEAISNGGLRPATNYEPIHRFVQALRTKMSVSGVELHAAGAKLNSSNVDLNTALIAGSDPVKLAAKIHGWCESHCWVEGPDREWMAGIIDRGLATGLYRQGLHYSEPGSSQRWVPQGWKEVAELLRSRDDEPVVLSYSVCDRFPNLSVGDWMPAWPDGVPETWEGYETLTDDQKRERDQRQDDWCELDESEKWRIAMDGIRNSQPWARLAPDTLSEVTFHYPVTVYDMLAPDRDDRIRAAVNAVEDIQEPGDPS